MLSGTISQEQEKALEGLAYWIADLHYMREKWGNDEPELDRARKTIELCCFPHLDALKTPFWMQNVVICWAENWRNYKEIYFRDFLKSKNIIIE